MTHESRKERLQDTRKVGDLFPLNENKKIVSEFVSTAVVKELVYYIIKSRNESFCAKPRD
jgi:hypothetical protein